MNKIIRTLRPYAGRFLNAAVGVRKMGWKDYSRLRSLSEPARPGLEILAEVRIPALLHPVYVRRGTSDAGELIHSAIREVYAKDLSSGPVRTIVDAGANMGDSAVWYLSRFPDAKVISIEPDSGNFELLQKNCAPYGPRAVCLEKGLWSSEARLRVHFYGGHSGITVEEVSEGPYDCESVTPLSVLRSAGAETIDIFKCDIEGAEQRLFESDCDPWISRTRSLYIEIHNDAAYRAVMTAMKRHPFRCRKYREIHIFSRI